MLEDNSSRIRYHAKDHLMVAMVVDVTGQPMAIHRTYLGEIPEGKKRKMMLGPVKGGAVRLGDHLAANSKMAVGEGIETCLSFQQTTGIPTWSAMTEGGLRGVEMPDPKPQTVYILADIDEEKMVQGKIRRVGQEAARKTAQRLMEMGIETFIVWPGDQTGSKVDFNDLLQTDPTGESIRTALAWAELVKPNQPDAPKDESWLDQMICSRNGIVANVANVLTAFRSAKEWKNVFGFNAFAWRVELISAPPWWGGGAWRRQELQDEHLTFAAEWMQRRDINVSSTLVHEAAYAVAMDHTFHPVQDFLSSRRFWPVACASVDANGLAAARKQLLAEAVAAFRAGESWWLSPEMEAVAALEQAERFECDEWTNKIKQYLYEDNCDFVTVGTILEQCLGITKGKWIQNDQNRVAKILKMLKWIKTRKKKLLK